jgi:hypothetical protein
LLGMAEKLTDDRDFSTQENSGLGAATGGVIPIGFVLAGLSFRTPDLFTPVFTSARFLDPIRNAKFSTSHCAKRQLLPQAEKVGVDGRTSALTISGASQIRPGRRAWSAIGRAEAEEYIAPIIGTKGGKSAWVAVSCKAPIRCGFPPTKIGSKRPRKWTTSP